MSSSTHKRPRVAVIGTGLAGLSTAYLLKQARATRTDGSTVDFDVHLFERSDALGMDTASLSIKDEDGSYRVDVPMRSINGGSHSRVHTLYRSLNVPLVKSDFTYSFSRLARSSPSLPSTAPDHLLAEPSSPSLPPTPPPEYREHASSSRPPTPLHHQQRPTPRRTGPRAAPKRAARPRQTTALLYEGASGLRLPPASIPSHLSRAPWRAQAAYCADVVAFTLAYLYLVVLALWYCALGLAYPPRSPPAPYTSTSRIKRTLSRVAKAVGATVPLRNVAREPLLEWCARHRVPRRFTDDILVPLMAAVATVGVVEARTMPVGEVLQYVSSTLGASHYVTDPAFGVRGIVAALARPVPPSNLHLGVEITRLERLASSPSSSSSSPSGGGGDAGYRLHVRTQEFETGEDVDRVLEFEHLVFATQADQAARLVSTLASPSPGPGPGSDEHERVHVDDDELAATLDALRAFTYVRTLVVTHTDESVLPPASSDRRDLNLVVYEREPAMAAAAAGGEDGEDGEDEQDEWDEAQGHLPPSSVETTHVVLSSRKGSSSSVGGRPPAERTVLQTTNPLTPISEAHTLASTWFSRAFVTQRSQRAVGVLAARHGHEHERGRRAGEPRARGLWFAGSYLASGIPLLEGCVTSAEAVVRGVIASEGATVERWAF
ncbi:hypothetical protein JCM3775_005816 [Rhodotorula graminis]